MVGCDLSRTLRRLVKIIREVLTVAGGLAAHRMLALMRRRLGPILCRQFVVLLRICFKLSRLRIKVPGEAFVVLRALRIADERLQILFAKQPAIGRQQEGAEGADRQQREPGASLSNQIQNFHFFVLQLKQSAAKLL